VPDQHGAAVVLERELLELRQRQADVLPCGRPLATGVADAAVLEVPGRDTLLGQRDAHVPGVNQVVGRLPVAAVEHEGQRERPGAGRHA
jgi:hypothetical protein